MTPDEEGAAYRESLPPLPNGWRFHERTADHWLEVVSADDSDALVIKWDGCAHYHNYSNGARHSDPESPEKEAQTGYVHVCDFKDWLRKMQELCDYAREVGICTE